MASSRKSTRRYQLNKTKYLSEQEYQHLIELLDRFESRNERDCLLIRLALLTGARAQEVLNIRRQDLSVEDRSVLIHGLKGSDDREIPLPAQFFQKLWRYSEKQKDILFEVTYNRFRQIWEIYRPAAKSLHSLRHTFAIHLYKKTKDVRLVQVALGHRNVMNTMIYADYVYSQQELRKLLVG